MQKVSNSTRARYSKNIICTNIKEANQELDLLMQDILDIQFQVNDPVFNSHLTDQQYALWRSRAIHSMKIKEQQRAFIKRWVGEQNKNEAHKYCEAKGLLRELIKLWDDEEYFAPKEETLMDKIRMFVQELEQG